MSPHRILQGDALELIPTVGKVDLVVTDPPYVIGAVSAGNIGSKAGTWHDMMNSAHWFAAWYRACARALKPTGAVWTFANWRSLPVVMKAASDAGLPVASCLVWDKDWIGPGGSVGLRPSYEVVALLPMPEFAIPDRGLPDVWREPWSSRKPHGHPAEKPVPLMRRIIDASGLGTGAIDRGDRALELGPGVVLDPFMGSGSTLVAAVECGCEAVGIEQSEEWIGVAEGRLASVPLFTT